LKVGEAVLDRDVSSLKSSPPSEGEIGPRPNVGRDVELLTSGVGAICGCTGGVEDGLPAVDECVSPNDVSISDALTSTLDIPA